MSAAKVQAIFIGETFGGPMSAVDAVRAVAGSGLEGDRYWQGEGARSKAEGPDREVTLIEAEAIEALGRDEGLPLDPSECRRNIVTRGVALNHLVGREFRVGEVTLRGLRLCEPCKHLEAMTRPGVMKGLLHRGGLRAQVLTDGVVRVADPLAV